MRRQSDARAASHTWEDADVAIGHERRPGGTGSAAAAAAEGSRCAFTSGYPMLSAAAVLTIG
jgi:hypothetical protein